MTTIQKKAVLGQANPIAHLTEADIEQIGIELDAIRQEVLDSRGASRRGVHPPGHRHPAQDRARLARGAALQRLPAGLGPRHRSA